jgi:hypothetical protein
MYIRNKDAGALKYYCYSKMYKIVGHSEVISLNYLAFQSYDFEIPGEGYSRNVHVH